MAGKKLTMREALQKLRHYCGYQERCHSEVRDKLYKLEVSRNWHDEILATLITEGYLDEERFAIAFAGGKFRISHWGKVKIKYSLKQKQVSEYSIARALARIKETDYLNLLKKLTKEKYASLSKMQWIHRRNRTMDYMMQKGFEPELIKMVLDQMKSRPV